MKTNPTNLGVALALVALPLLAWSQALPLRAPPDGANHSANHSEPSRRIEGLWDEQVVQVDCDKGTPIRLIGRGTNLFVRGGSLVATNNAPPVVMGITLGQWRYAGGHGRKFRVRMRLNLFQPPAGSFSGIREIHRSISLTDGGNRLVGTVHTQDYLPDGAPTGDPICARETGIRVPAP